MMGVFDSIELRMLRRADYVPTLFPTQVYVLTAFCGQEHVSLWGAYALSHSLLSLAFATRWNQKHQSYVRIRLFFKIPEPWHIQNQKHIQNLVKYLRWSVLQKWLTAVIIFTISTFHVLYFMKQKSWIFLIVK